MNNMKHKILMTLALLITAVGGAWAAEFTSLKVGDVLHVGDVINTNTNYTVYGYYLDASYQPATLVRADISGPTTITESETGAYYLLKGNDGYFYGVIQDLLNGYTGGYWPVTATSDGISVTAINPGSSTELTFDVHEGSSTEPPLAVEWNASTKTGTFEMPAYDVELTPLYAPVAQWAKVENVDQLPTAIEGIYAESTDAIVKAGTVAKIGETENPQGTVMYAVTSTNQATAPALDAFSADVPTAENITVAGDVLVWYYIKGADTPTGEKATAENTFNDSEICTEPITVTVLSNKFDIQFKAANDNTIEAGKATVTVGGTAATVTEGKLEGVKMGSEVKMTAKEGYKFRKAEGKKKTSIVPVTAITLNKTETSIKVGATETLSVTSVLPEEATDKTYTWKTSDETKATVDQDGKVTAVAEGTVTIYAEANDGSGVKGNCTVTVTPAPVPVTVTWNNNDITGTGNSFTKGGVTLTAGQIDYKDKDISLDGTFTTTLGNFTKIEVTTAWFSASGTGWSSGTGITPKTGTWTGNASSVSFSGNIWGQGEGNTKFVFTIEPKN